MGVGVWRHRSPKLKVWNEKDRLDSWMEEAPGWMSGSMILRYDGCMEEASSSTCRSKNFQAGWLEVWMSKMPKVGRWDGRRPRLRLNGRSFRLDG